MIEILGVALKEGDGRKLGLLRVQILRFRKLKQRADVKGLRRINDDDAFTLLELIDNVIAVERGADGHGNGYEEPEPREAVPLGEQLRRVKALPSETRGCCAVPG